ncbi:MAG TPA: serine hydrolase domain-containing protein [Saprospiraceae bacterium]|nr:serine hydrolase domain-containing protein [Saprospiraceae bacterium]
MRILLVLYFLWISISESLAQNVDWKFRQTLDSLLKTYSLGKQAPGFAVCIVEHGNIVYEFQTGLANLELNKPITSNTIFNIGSVSKQFTAACVALLQEQGKLRLTDPVHQYIPELPDFGAEITLNHLISHTSGLHGHIDVMNLAMKYKNERLQPEAIFNFYRKMPTLAFAPGTDFAYNNTAYQLLSIVIERVSGMPTADFMQKEIFTPLGMKDTRFCLLESEGLPDGTVSYLFQEGKKKYRKDNKTHNMLGATGVHCTLRDLALWQNNFDRNTLVKSNPEFFSVMELMYLLNDNTRTHYGRGLLVKQYKGKKTVEHGGGWNSFLIQSRRFPVEGLNILVASNNLKSSPFPIADAISDHILSFANMPKNLSSRLDSLRIPVANLCGKYLASNNKIRIIRVDADTLKVRLDESTSGKEIPVVYAAHKSSDTLVTFFDPATGFVLAFKLAPDKQVAGFFWEGGDYFRCNRWFEKLDERPVPARQWAGRYKTSFYPKKVRIKNKGNSMVLKPVFFMRYPLEQISPTVFKIRKDGVVIRFTSSGFILGDEWVRNLKFSRI